MAQTGSVSRGGVDPIPVRRVRIGAAPVDAQSLRGAAEEIVRRARGGKAPAYVVTPNAHHVVLLEESETFRRAYEGAWMSVADSVPLLWASGLLGYPLPGRVNGTDLFEAVCEVGAPSGLRVFLLGGRPGSAARAADVLARRYPGLVITGAYCPPYGFERDARESEQAVQEVRAAAAEVLFVGLGAPKQELWMYDNREAAGVPVSLGIGGSFELISGMLPRAPRWMQEGGLEWLFRLGIEPRRLWRRYAISIPGFLWIVTKQLLRRRRPPNSGSEPKAQ